MASSMINSQVALFYVCVKPCLVGLAAEMNKTVETVKTDETIVVF